MILQPVVPLKKIDEVSISAFKDKTYFSISFFEFVGYAQAICRGFQFNSVATGLVKNNIEFHECEYCPGETLSLSTEVKLYLALDNYYRLESLMDIARKIFPGYSFQELKIRWGRKVFWFDTN